MASKDDANSSVMTKSSPFYQYTTKSYPQENSSNPVVQECKVQLIVIYRMQIMTVSQHFALNTDEICYINPNEWKNTDFKKQ